MGDLIGRQAAIDTRRYTFGNDEFSLEAAYHDCKLVFDGITDDDSFQEADTGLILYYANEIIYALQEALEGKDTNVPINDTISRQAAIDALEWKWAGKAAMDAIKNLPSAQPWIPCSERMPKDGRQVLVYARSVHFAIAKYDEMRNADGSYTRQWVTFDAWKPFYTIKEVIAWMPLPEPYRSET